MHPRNHIVIPIILWGVLLDYGYDVYPVNPMLAATKKDNDGNTIKIYNRTIYSSMEDISNIGIKID